MFRRWGKNHVIVQMGSETRTSQVQVTIQPTCSISHPVHICSWDIKCGCGSYVNCIALNAEMIINSKMRMQDILISVYIISALTWA